MTGRERFAGGDPAYLRDVQYADSSKLEARSRLHRLASTAATPWFSWLASQVEWPPTAAVVEAGCGAGSLWVEAATSLPADLRLLLTDQSLGMVAEAVVRVDGLGRVASVAGLAADVQALPFPDGCADVVVANHMLYHAPSPEQGVRELARVLRPDGVALIATNGADHMRQLSLILGAVFAEDDPLAGAVSRFGREVGEGILRRHFADVEWRPFEDVLVCTEPSDVLGYMLSFPPGEDATPDERAALEHAVDDAFAAAGGVLRITKDTGTFLAQTPNS